MNQEGINPLVAIQMALAGKLDNRGSSYQFSLFIDRPLLSLQSVNYLLIIMACSLIIGLIPGITAYRRALQQQLS